MEKQSIFPESNITCNIQLKINKKNHHVLLHMVDHSAIDSLVKDFLNAMAINTANKGLRLQKPTHLKHH